MAEDEADPKLAAHMARFANAHAVTLDGSPGALERYAVLMDLEYEAERERIRRRSDSPS